MSKSSATPSTTKVQFLEQAIRDGFTSEDVRMWQQLCRDSEVAKNHSHEHMFVLLDIARHNDCPVLDIIKMGRQLSNEKVVNDKFVAAIIHAVASDDEDNQFVPESSKVLDLTADESSGSYEEEETHEQRRAKVTVLSSKLREDEMYNDNPSSAEAYEIDGFVVPDHHSDPESSGVEVLQPKKGVKRLLKRKIQFDEC